MGVIMVAGGSAGFAATCWHANILAITHSFQWNFQIGFASKTIFFFSICFS